MTWGDPADLERRRLERLADLDELGAGLVAVLRDLQAGVLCGRLIPAPPRPPTSPLCRWCALPVPAERVAFCSSAHNLSWQNCVGRYQRHRTYALRPVARERRALLDEVGVGRLLEVA